MDGVKPTVAQFGKTQCIWVSSRQQLANVTVTEILLDSHSNVP